MTTASWTGRVRHWLWFAYQLARNTRIAVRNAVFGVEYAEWHALRRRGRVVVGEATYGIPTVHTFEGGTERLLAGNYCSLGGTYLLGGQHAVDLVTTYPHRILWRMPGAGSDGFPTPQGDTVVGSDVWTAYESLILSGVTIGDGAIVAAGAVVTKDVPPFAIVGGNPAKVIRYRFNPEQIEALLEIRWWDWPREEVRAAVPYLTGDVDDFIAYARERRPAPAASPRSAG